MKYWILASASLAATAVFVVLSIAKPPLLTLVLVGFCFTAYFAVKADET